MEQNKAMDMLVEYVLEENVSMKTQIRELEQENRNIKEQNKVYFDIEAEWGKELSHIKKEIERCIIRDTETNKPSVISIYDDNAIEELLHFLRIPYDTPSSI